MKNTISTICFCIISIIGNSQVWTEPVNISNMNSSIQSCDFVIDNAGIYHCVWNLKLSDSHSVLYYSKSNDNGLSWYDPENISQNDTRYYTNPVIDVNSDNNLFVAFDNYDYSDSDKGAVVSIITYEVNSWSEVFDLGYGFETRIEIDTFDNVYVFWFQGLPHDGVFHYRSFLDGEWSDLVTPYENTAAMTFIENIQSDSEGNLHCVGQYVPTSTVDFYPAYFKFNGSSQQWDSEITVLSESPSSTSKIDIDLFSNEEPAISRSGHILYYYPTLYENEEIINDVYTYYTSVIITGNNLVNIISLSVEGGMMKLMLHWKANRTWMHTCLDSAFTTIFTPKMLQVENSLDIVYEKSDIAGEGDVYLFRTDIETSLYEDFLTQQSILEVYPNPANDIVSIRFSGERSVNIHSLSIIDLQGSILKRLNVKSEDGEPMYVEWNGFNEKGDKVSPGVYLCICKSDLATIVKKFVYLP
jgi:hypothetical protein